MPLALAFILSLAIAQQRPSVPANLGIRDAAPGPTVSSGEDAYVYWSVDPATTGMSYDISQDNGPWTRVTAADLIVVPLSPADAATKRTYAVRLGKLSPGAHGIVVRECLTANRTQCAPSAAVIVTVVPPVPCDVGPWGDWTSWGPGPGEGWIRETFTSTVEARYRTRSRAITQQPGVGAPPCPNQYETAKEIRAYVPPAPPTLDPVTVAYVKMDSATKGAWRGVYGADGQVYADPAAKTLPFVTVTPVRALVWTWAASTADERGLQKPAPADPADRLASAWYASDSFELDVRFSDTAVHQVALYAVDWDNQSRAQRIEVTDSQGGVKHTLDTGPELKTGVYYVWRISGHARIRVTRTAGANAVVFGVLFGS